MWIGIDGVIIVELLHAYVKFSLGKDHQKKHSFLRSIYNMYMRLPKLAYILFLSMSYTAPSPFSLIPPSMFPPLFLFSILCTDGKALRKFFQKLGCLG